MLFRDVTGDQWRVVYFCILVTVGGSWISANNRRRVRDGGIVREYPVHSNWNLLLFRYGHSAANFRELIRDLKGVCAIRADIAVRRHIHRHAGLRCGSCSVACHVFAKGLCRVQALVIL